jgi:hypothetical protein
MSKSKKAIKVEAHQQPQNDIYPTEWQGGIPRGSVQDKGNFYRVVMSAPGVDQYSKPFYASRPKRRNDGVTNDQICNNKTEALIAAEKYRLDESNKYGITRNVWRKIDGNTIEVKIDDDKTFFTDFEYVNKVEMYPVFAKKVHNKFHVVSQDKKRQFNFYTLIKPTINIVDYMDNDPFNLRSSNIRELGTVEIATKVKEKTDVDKSYDFTIDHYSLTKYTDVPYVLPKNIWILGKPAGTIFEKESHIIARISNGEKYASKTFKFDDTTKELQYESARRWQYITSYKLGLTKNLIKILDNKYVEVQLTKDHVTKTNIELIHIIQLVAICVTKSSNMNSKYYAMISIDRTSIKFHNFITQNKMTDHIDGDTLNNTLENIRSCDYSINNINRHIDKDNVGLEKLDRCNNRYLQTTLSIEGEGVQKRFYFTTKKQEELKQERTRLIKIAHFYRQFVLYGIWDDKLIPHIDQKDCIFVNNYFNKLIQHHKYNLLTKNNYIESLKKTIGLDLSQLTQSIIYTLYIKTRTDQLNTYSDTLKIVSDIMDNKIN